MLTSIEELRLASPRPTRELILDQAEKSIALKGVFGFQMKDIAEPLNIKVPAIYKHFKNRDDMLVGVSKRFILLLSEQFQFSEHLTIKQALRKALSNFIDLNVRHPAFVLLALIDFATPEGGIEYVKIAAGGTFKENLEQGPLSAMHARIRTFLSNGYEAGLFRPIDALQFYRVVYSNTLLSLVFPENLSLDEQGQAEHVEYIKSDLIDVIERYLFNDERLGTNQNPEN